MADGSLQSSRVFLFTELPLSYFSEEGILFRKALNYISDKRNWCQYEVSRLVQRLEDDAIGFHVAETFKNVPGINPVPVRRIVQYEQVCSIGALWMYSISGKGREHYIVRQALDCASGDIARFNDKNSHQDVIALWKRVGRDCGWLHSSGE